MYHMVTKARIGSVSHGTMLAEDVDQEQQDYCLDALFDALNDLAPSYCYFGSQEGDGADYGFWISWERIEEDIADGVILKVPAGSENNDPLPEDVEYFLEVNDHGNAILFTRTGEEVWSCV